MSPNSEQHSALRTNARGFTLTELLVAMAIFVTLMGSLVMLFGGTVDTTRAGYARLAAFEAGRTIVEVMKRDLGAAFTARDYGDNQQFYGRENGFTFVGANEEGELSRISYALVRVDDRNDFLAHVVNDLGTLVRRAMTQGAKFGVQSDPTLAPGPITGIIMAQNLCSALAEVGAVPVGTAGAAWNQLEGMKNTFNLTGNFGVNINAPFLALGVDDFLVDVESVYQMAHLLRYEEPGQSNLEAFQLPGDKQAVSAAALDSSLPRNAFKLYSDWPKLRPDQANLDIFDADLEGSISNFNVYLYEVSAVNFDPAPSLFVTPSALPDPSLDLRSYLPLYSYITRDTLENMLRANRRKVWIDFLTRSPLDTSGGLLSFWRVPEAPGDPVINPAIYSEPRENPLDFVIAENFVWRAVLRGSDASLYTNLSSVLPPVSLYHADGTLLDLLGTPTFFSYAQGNANADGAFLDTFNANENIAGYKDLVRLARANPAIAPTYFGEFDRVLANAHTGFKSEIGLQGSPLVPRIPSLIKVQFWTARRGPGTGDPAIRHWFAEVVDVPTGMTRRAPASIVASGG